MEEKRIEEVLERLEALYSGWGISPDEWLLIGGWALRFQGYDTQKDMNELDTLVLREKLPWTPLKDQYRERLPALITVPPRDSKEMAEIIEFLEYIQNITGNYYTLLIHPEKRDLFRPPKMRHRLPSGKVIYLLSVSQFVNAIDWLIPVFGSFGEERWVQDHLEYIQEIKRNAEHKRELHIAKECELIMQKHSR